MILGENSMKKFIFMFCLILYIVIIFILRKYRLIDNIMTIATAIIFMGIAILIGKYFR